MSELIAANMQLILYSIITAIMAAVYFAYRQQIDFWWMNFWYGLPLIGKAHRLSKDHSQASQAGWFNAERTLCKDYKKFIHFKSREEFEKYQTYLRKAEDNGRTPTPLAIMLIMVVLVAAEGLGFSYMLGTWMASEGSANTHNLLMWAIVFVLATILAFITHAAGHQLYRTSLVKRSMTGWAQANPKPDLSRIGLGLQDNQHKDDDQPDYVQVLARVGRNYSYVMVIIAVLAITGIAALSTWMRYENLVRHQTEQTMGTSSEATANGNPFAAGGAGTEGLVIPNEVADSQKEAQEQGLADSNDSMKSEGIAAFLTLAIIFIVTQIVGIYAGFKWGFAGKESKKAYEATRGFATYEEFNAYYDPRIDTAQAMLQSMQQEMAANAINGDRKTEKTFRDYLLEDRQSKAEFQQPNTATTPVYDNAVAAGQTVGAAVQAAPLQTAAAPAPISPAAVQVRADQVASIDEALQALDTFSDKQQKKAYLDNLPAQLRDGVIDEIRHRKAAEAAAERAKRDAELDSLLD